jgi:hypothetical protein
VGTNKKLTMSNLNKVFLPLLLLGTILISCNKERKERIFYWNETQCSNPWKLNPPANDEAIKEAVRKYLNVQGITATAITTEVRDELIQNCEACTCTTGRRIIIHVQKNRASKMEKLNFTPL